MARGLIDRALRMGESKQFKEHESRVETINAIEPEMELLDDSELLKEADASASAPATARRSTSCCPRPSR